MLVIKINTE